MGIGVRGSSGTGQKLYQAVLLISSDQGRTYLRGIADLEETGTPIEDCCACVSSARIRWPAMELPMGGSAMMLVVVFYEVDWDIWYPSRGFRSKSLETGGGRCWRFEGHHDSLWQPMYAQ